MLAVLHIKERETLLKEHDDALARLRKDQDDALARLQKEEEDRVHKLNKRTSKSMKPTTLRSAEGKLMSFILERFISTDKGNKFVQQIKDKKRTVRQWIKSSTFTASKYLAILSISSTY